MSCPLGFKHIQFYNSTIEICPTDCQICRISSTPDISFSMLSFSFILYLAGLVIIVKVFSQFLKNRRYALEAARKGCAPPPALPSKGLFNLGRLSEASAANKAGRYPQWFGAILDEVGKDVHTIRASVLGNEVVITRDPEIAKAMFSGQSADFEISPYRKEIWGPLLGNGIFTAEGETWKHSRAFLRPQFTRDQISNLELQDEHIQRLFQTSELQGEIEGWTSKVDLAPLFLDFTLEVATEFLYGKDNSREDQRCENGSIEQGFGYHLDAGKSYLYTKGLFAPFHQLLYSPKLTKHCKEVHRIVDKFVAGRLSQTKSFSDSTRWFLLDELAKHSQNPLELRNETLQILNAGRDTTGYLLGWTFYFLARHPTVYSKLRAAILHDFGPSTTSEVSFQNLRTCDYLTHTVQEVLRIAGVAPLNERFCTRDTTLPRGGGSDGQQPIFLAKGQRILLAKYAMQHREDIWGADVEEFKPERWNDRRIGWEFMPFGGGPRKCIGRKYTSPQMSSPSQSPTL